MDIRFNIVKKGEEIPKVYPMGHPRKEYYRSMVHLEGTPDLVLILFDEIAKYARTRPDEEGLVIV